jgi:hypothetical protein
LTHLHTAAAAGRAATCLSIKHTNILHGTTAPLQ